MFNFIKDKIIKVYHQVTQRLSALFSRDSFDEDFIEELKIILLTADAGVKTTTAVVDELNEQRKLGVITEVAGAKKYLEELLIKRLTFTDTLTYQPRVVLLVGVNGTGKTTFAAKYAHLLKKAGKRVVLVAADTFRAAAVNQLKEWANRIGVVLFSGKEGQDPASVVFDACDYFKKESIDHIIIDTAGRLQTKVNLMRELEKIHRIIERQLGSFDSHTWLTIDSMIGQNSVQQAKLFYDSTQISGLILTKFDGTGKGGALFSITEEIKVPVMYVTFGEALEDVRPFNVQEYVQALLNE